MLRNHNSNVRLTITFVNTYLNNVCVKCMKQKNMDVNVKLILF